MLDRATDPWGVHVDRVEIKDVTIPQNMQRSMAAEAEATRDARAKVRNTGFFILFLQHRSLYYSCLIETQGCLLFLQHSVYIIFA